jgi:ADP-ribose pyrophosphatase
VREDVAEMPNGKTTLYGVIECREGVGILPFLDDDRVVMVRQFRYPFGENHRWEMPTGGVEAGESLEEAAHRELREEIGYDAARLVHVSSFHTSNSILDEVAHLYLGDELTHAQAILDETEFLELAVFPFREVYDLVLASEFRDSLTIIAVLHAARLRGWG